MSRDQRLFLRDIQRGSRKVIDWAAGLSQEQFIADEMRRDAVLRNLQIIDEAVKQLPPELRDQHPAVPWRRIARFRDIVTHAYFGLDDDIVWDIVQNKVPELLAEVERMLQDGER